MRGRKMPPASLGQSCWKYFRNHFYIRQPDSGAGRRGPCSHGARKGQWKGTEKIATGVPAWTRARCMNSVRGTGTAEPNHRTRGGPQIPTTTKWCGKTTQSGTWNYHMTRRAFSEVHTRKRSGSWGSGTSTPTFTAASFTAAKRWQRPKGPSTDDGYTECGPSTGWIIQP